MKSAPTPQKLRGGYYTPEVVAGFLSNWAIRSSSTTVLEPGCGNGQLLEPAVRKLLNLGGTRAQLGRLLTGVEIERNEAGKAVSLLSALGVPRAASSIHVRDFFQFATDCIDQGRKFDAVVGNPPFIRYQIFPDSQREPAFAIMESAGLHPTRLTNAWVPFVVASTRLLSSHGRIGLVLPAELLQVGYTAELRRFLTQEYSRITLVTFRTLLFGEAVQQEVVLFLGETNGAERTGIRTVEMESASQLEGFSQDQVNSTELKPLDHSTDKWTKYFLDSEEILLLRDTERLPGLSRVQNYASIDVGIVTGCNDFFVLSEAQVGEWGLSEYVRPLVARSPHLDGIVFSEEDWDANAQSGRPAFLLDLPDVPRDRLSTAAKRYIDFGESAGAHTGYKCRIREPWWVLPAGWVPSAFMLRQIHDYPKIVDNQAKATSTDTIHRVRITGEVSSPVLALSFLNSLTLAHAEVVGRSYGGGVLELEPREAEHLLLPPPLINASEARRLDSLVRRRSIEDVLEFNDQALLREGIGLSQAKIDRLRGVWSKLRDRRNGRRRVERRTYSQGQSHRFPGRGSGIAST